jgi:hypothetical protein
MQERFAVEFSIESLFDKQTVAELAEVVETEQLVQAGGDELARILAEVEGAPEV